ncbi:beta-fructofuranosidase, insoluble isoenzyme CWINV1-like isoform X2 [Telopea speciosissima]|uniref:beta-fructofuranosidase, insoluble isoenzyme CWINV1-like isoform X2 n=1 Tax=Telopea speciosissima TaxID=54955 RepID=UPI001CC4D196|nr:beta-fructofuranosidase, insoluble isoenzyme CWINV1-like isoform X2 [Telopea speciosissima]
MAFTVVRFIGLCSLLLGYGVHVEASHLVILHLQSHQNTTATHQPYRTGYHFQPAKNWINGPIIYKGIYHLFYQYNPYGAVWGNIVWAHATSTDLVNWVHHEIAIKPSIDSDINGCWSGSATILPGDKPAILYTGIDPQNRQVQNLAVPKNLSDQFLREWIKPPQNPVMTPIDGINASSFRDPSTAWKGSDGRWRVIIGSKIDQQGKAILYRSKDFIHWVRAQHPLHSSNNTGMWECPDFFPVSVNSTVGLDTSVNGPSVKHVLKMSLNDKLHDYYQIGTYDLKMDKFVPVDNGSFNNGSDLRYDYGKFYASKTFFDSSMKRRILWGWINESDSEQVDVNKGWSGVQAIPRNLWLDKTGKQVVQWPIEEIEKLHEKPIDWHNTELKAGSVLEVLGVTASQADVDVSFDLSTLENAENMDPSWANPQMLCSEKGSSVKGSLGPFGLLVLASKGLEEQTAIFFRVFKPEKSFVVLMCSDQSRSSLGQDLDKTTYGAFLDVDPLQEGLSLRSLIDHSIVESFGGKGKACITARVYPELAINENVHLFVFNNGTENVRISKLKAWSMKKAQITY